MLYNTMEIPTSRLPSSARLTSVKPNTPLEDGVPTATTPDRREGCEDGSQSDSLVSLECFLEAWENKQYTKSHNNSQ